MVYYGAGKHIQHVTPDELKHWFMASRSAFFQSQQRQEQQLISPLNNQLYYVCICLYLSISFAVKSSILLFLRRVFPVRKFNARHISKHQHANTKPPRKHTFNTPLWDCSYFSRCLLFLELSWQRSNAIHPSTHMTSRFSWLPTAPNFASQQ